jgi:hypothetical protein
LIREGYLQAKLSPSQFRTFKACSSDLASGGISAKSYHTAMVKLGLATCIPLLMNADPSGARRREVMAVHDEYISSGSLPVDAVVCQPLCHLLS